MQSSKLDLYASKATAVVLVCLDYDRRNETDTASRLSWNPSIGQQAPRSVPPAGPEMRQDN